MKTHDRFGNRVDVVEFHPAYHELMELIYGSQTHSFAWTNQRPGAHVARGVLSYLWNQPENGICCPMGMTFASVPALRHDEDLLGQWQDRILAPVYDPRPVHAGEKSGVTVGMAMTEKQGGSDLRATMTTAAPASSRAGAGAPYLLTGHKWFFSVPMSDLFLTLARTDKGLSCFLATDGCWTARATDSSCSASRTSAATSPTPHRKSNSMACTPRCSERRARGSAPSSRWPMPPAWILPSARAA